MKLWSGITLVIEKLPAPPSDTAANQNIENFRNCDTVSDDVNNQCNKSSLSLEGQQQEQEEIKKANLDRQLKEIRQQYHTVFHATKQQLVRSDKGTKNISFKNQTHYKYHAHCR